ncbi:MAG: 5-(carboxyamino)imidazole ribonucleotide synthase [Methylococcaceae bacterium]
MKIGIIGAGQLARMMALAGYPLGADFIFLDPSAEACAGKVGELMLGNYDDVRVLGDLADQVDVVTYEFENVPAEVVAFLAERVAVYPPAQALATAQDRLIEKNFFNELGIPTPRYQAIDGFADLVGAMPSIGYPAILKGRTQGYDGKGQFFIHSSADLKEAIKVLDGKPAIIESFVDFNREISIIAVRSISGEIKFYPISENKHRSGILRVAQCRENDAMQAQAQDYITRLLNALEYVGVLALELFEVDGQLIANEFAPRVHNSGHWTIEGAETSQFENHCRAVMDLPLGSTAPVGKSAMVNFIGGLSDSIDILNIPCSHLHLYDKAPRKGRKVAHATIRTNTEAQLTELVAQLSTMADSVDDS